MKLPQPAPSAFLGGPAYHPPVTPPSKTEDAPATYYDRLQQTPPVKPIPKKPAPPPEPPAPPLLTVTQSACVLSRAFVKAAKLQPGSRVNLVPPTQRGGQWYFDTNPKPGAGRTLPKAKHATARFRPPAIGLLHFTKSVPIARGRGKSASALATNTTIAGSAVVRLTKLTFQLGAQVEGHPGYYELLSIENAKR